MSKPNLPGYRTEAEKANQLGVTVRTLRKWRQRRIGPPFAKYGKTVVYPDDDDWLRNLVQQPIRSRRAA